jgi:hypothetical protein
MTARRKYKHTDNSNLQKDLTTVIRAVLENMFGPSITKVNSSTLMHTDLQPEGDLFTLNFVVELHEKADPPPEKEKQ